MKRPGSSAFFAFSVARAELDLAVLVARLARDDVDDLQSDPHRPGAGNRLLRTGARMPSRPDVFEVANAVGAVPGPHEFLGGLGLTLADVQLVAAPAEGLTRPARARIEGIHWRSGVRYGSTSVVSSPIRARRFGAFGSSVRDRVMNANDIRCPAGP